MQNIKQIYKRRKLLLIMPVLLLPACASKSVQPIAISAPLPVQPSLSTPLPAVTYSESAAQLIKSWQAKLTDTLPTSD